jgi:hypothetical protein
MAPRYERIPSRLQEEELDDLGLDPDRRQDIVFDTRDPVNDRAWKGAGEKHSPDDSGSPLSSENINSRASPPPRRKQ